MNIFIAGVHGVGKSYLASHAALKLGFKHISASDLIKEERSFSTWGANKQVDQINDNQDALIRAVKRQNHDGVRLLLDGHFVLINKSGELMNLNATVFSSLNLIGVLLIEADPILVARRLELRDQQRISLRFIENYMLRERLQARKVCDKLRININVLKQPTQHEFQESVLRLQNKKRRLGI